MSVIKFPGTYAPKPKADDQENAPRQYKRADWQLPPDVRARFIKAHAAYLVVARAFHDACLEVNAAGCSQYGITESEAHQLSVSQLDPDDDLLALLETDFSDGNYYEAARCLIDPETGTLLEEMPTDPQTGERMEGQG